MMRPVFATLLLTIATACAARPDQDYEAGIVADGRDIAVTQCGGCHATGRSDASPRADAPALRHVFSRYARRPLDEAFIEGLKVGHPDMPLFQMAPRGADSLMAYLQSIQTPETER